MEIREHASTSPASMHFNTPNGPDLKRSGDVTRFTEVDLTPDARFFVDFMDHANAQPDRQQFRKIMAERLNISAGDRVLDVGCGTGDDVRMLALLV
jgi:SAM-dependent methyltransferase